MDKPWRNMYGERVEFASAKERPMAETPTPETLSERIAAEFLRDPFCRVDKADQLVKEVERLLEVEKAAKELRARVEADVLGCYGMWNDAQFRGAPESWRGTIMDIVDSGRVALGKFDAALRRLVEPKASGT